jgi:hypothetical protein
MLTSTLLFVDETGLNPLPAGIEVTVVDGNGDAIGSAYTSAGGFCAITVTNSVAYTASFFGKQAPSASQAFVGTGFSPTIVTVANYESPSRVAASYAAMYLGKLPPRRVAQSAKMAGGNAYAIAQGLGSVAATLDASVQQLMGADRLQSGTGSAIDTWAADFIKPGYWDRFPGEYDQAYIERVLAWLASPFTTLPGIVNLVNLYMAAKCQSERLSPVPTVIGFDYQTQPALMANLGLVQTKAPFVIEFIFPNGSAVPAWFLDNDYLNDNSEPSSGGTYLGGSPLYPYSPASDIIALVNRIKGNGTVPWFYTNTASPPY